MFQFFPFSMLLEQQHKKMFKHTRTGTHTYTYTQQTHTHTHTRRHTHTHTHTQIANFDYARRLTTTPSQKNMVFRQSSSRRSKKIRLCEYISQKKFQVNSWSRTIRNGRSKFWEFGGWWWLWVILDLDHSANVSHISTQKNSK